MAPPKRKDKTLLGETIAALIKADRNVIMYRPNLNAITGSLTATVFLNQVWHWWERSGNQPFYKFLQPCNHPLYRPGDSFCEELGMERDEFEAARSKLAVRWFKRMETLGFTKEKFLEDHLIIYWVDADRKTWYAFNEELYIAKLEALYTQQYEAKGGESGAHANAENPTWVADAENPALTDAENPALSKGENPAFNNRENRENQRSQIYIDAQNAPTLSGEEEDAAENATTLDDGDDDETIIDDGIQPDGTVIISSENVPSKKNGRTRVKKVRAPAPKHIRAPTPPDDPGAQQRMVGALARILHADIRMMAAPLGQEASKLRAAGYTPEQVWEWYGSPKGWWYTKYYLGKEGKLPNIATINKTIGMASRGIDPESGNGKSSAAPTPADPKVAEQTRLRQQWALMNADQHQRFLATFVEAGVVDAQGKLLPLGDET